jgi:hypothetical protein
MYLVVTIVIAQWLDDLPAAVQTFRENDWVFRCDLNRLPAFTGKQNFAFQDIDGFCLLKVGGELGCFLLFLYQLATLIPSNSLLWAYALL